MSKDVLLLLVRETDVLFVEAALEGRVSLCPGESLEPLKQTFLCHHQFILLHCLFLVHADLPIDRSSILHTAATLYGQDGAC